MSNILAYVISFLVITSNFYSVQSQTEIPTTLKSEILGDASVVFIADELRRDIIPLVNECWTSVKNRDTAENKDDAITTFSNNLLKNLKPYHDKILEIDEMITEHAPYHVLDPIVNLTQLEGLENATDFVDSKDFKGEWIDKVKVGWVRVQSLTSQISWKYEWVINKIFGNGISNDIEMELITQDQDLLYYAWNPVEGRGEGSEKYHLNVHELPKFLKTILTGEEKPEDKHDLFYGLKALLDLQEDSPNNNLPDDGSNKSCIGNQTFAGIRPTVNNYIPVFVLLHLLNSEFKYYITRNVASMYQCVQSGECNNEENAAKLEEHLDTFYKFYFGGIVRAFHANVAKSMQNDNDPKTWRWRCDPKEHVEDTTYTRFIDFETGFVANEKDLSATETCRETCDSFDGGFTKIPCPQSNYSCLGQEGDFDCMDKVKHNIPCPDPSVERICPYGIRCETTQLETAKICKKNSSSSRYLEWIDTKEYDAFLGKETPCDADTIEMQTSETTERSEISKYDPQKCELCLCKCFEPLLGDSHRYLSLNPATAKIQEGYVVVGTKFVKIKNIIYIKIAEAKVVDGVIDEATVNWIDPEEVTNTTNPEQVFRLGSDSRKLLLDDLTVPEGYALTGLRFNSSKIPIYEDYEKTSHEAKYSLAKDDTLSWKFGFFRYEVRLEAQITKLTENGALDVDNSTWISNENTTDSREEINLGDLDNPILTPESSEPVVPNSNNMYVTVQSSSLKKDAAQTPVPFFDAQDLLEPKSITMVQNIGIFLKGQPGFGGFVTFRFKSKPKSLFIPPLEYDLWRLIRKGLYSEYIKE